MPWVYSGGFWVVGVTWGAQIAKKLPIGEWDELVLVRNIGLNSVGVLNSISIRLAASLEIPHHEGAGGRRKLCL